jgi:hypothetical protein
LGLVIFEKGVVVRQGAAMVVKGSGVVGVHDHLPLAVEADHSARTNICDQWRYLSKDRARKEQTQSQ